MEGKSLVSILLDWVPMLMLIGVWIFFMRKQGQDGFSMPGDKERLDELRRQTRLLERIADSLERRRDAH